MAKRCTAKEWEEIVAGVQAILPLSNEYEVSIERKKISDGPMEGYCQCLDADSAKFRVVVSSDVSSSHATEILIHELAHLMDWKPYTPWTMNHGPTFWIHYGELYRAYHQVL